VSQVDLGADSAKKVEFVTKGLPLGSTEYQFGYNFEHAHKSNGIWSQSPMDLVSASNHHSPLKPQQLLSVEVAMSLLICYKLYN
jgi:hypothetical protein